jgi:CPA2 family monovalent cation:H+ antiporter-2
MHPLPFLQSFVILLAAAVVIVWVSRPLRLPGVVGFLLTGIIIGPYGLQLVPDRTIIEVFAEFGVVMLLFFIGLEFSLAQLRRIGRQFLMGGSLQVFGTAAAVVALLTAFDLLALNERVFIGFVVMLSSTAIILKMLADRDELDAPHGRLAVGISLFQDFAIVPIIVLAPILAGRSDASTSDIVLRFVLSVAAVGAVFYVARRLMPRVLRTIATSRVREIFLLGSLLICLALAEATFSLGFSYALGAFLAGLIVSESEYSHEVVAEIVPFRDLFSSLFFISVGMLLDMEFVLNAPVTVFGMGIGLIVLKAAIVMILVRLMGYSTRTSILSALFLAQIGEFSFVLFNVGRSVGLLEGDLYQYFLSASIFSMVVSPPLILAAPWIAERLHHQIPLAGRPTLETKPDRPLLRDHVIIVGYGLNGRNVARVLRETGIPFVVLENEIVPARLAKHDGVPVLYGDASRKDILTTAGVERARLIVIVISEAAVARSVTSLSRLMNPTIEIVVRTRSVSEVEELTSLGADDVIPEEFETSIEIFTRVLDRFHIPRNVINAQIKVIRDENYGMLRGLPQTSRGLEKMTQILAAGTSDTFLVTDDTRAAGTSVLELKLREHTGAMLIAVVRGDTPILTPDPTFRIEPGDTLVLVGTHENMDRAFDYLSMVPPTS